MNNNNLEQGVNQYATHTRENYDYIYERLEQEIQLNVRGSYPNNAELDEETGLPKYRYETRLVKIDFDQECEQDLIKGTGFIITKKQNLKKDLKSDQSIFSPKFGLAIDDMTPFGDVYKCKCGRTMMKVNNGLVCDICHTKVKYVSNDFSITGWIKVEEPYFIIHPNLYKELFNFIGLKHKKSILESILEFDSKIDEDGFAIKKEVDPANPFNGIGMMEFKDRIYEILEFYHNKGKNSKTKMEYYDDIMNNMDKLFCHSIPVYTTQLRPYSINKNKFTFEGNNARYNVIAGLATRLNKNKIYSRGKQKGDNGLMYDIQMKFMEIYTDLEEVLAKKKGYIRALNGGRYNFTARNVIIPDKKLEIDQIILPYTTLIELLSLTIINILTKTHTPSEAYRIWDEARIMYNPTIGKLIQSIIDSEYIGILLNRNPSISPASIIQLQVVGMSHDNTYSCRVPHEILSSMGADFDGDTLNIMLIINQQFLTATAKLFNPRLAMQIDPNDGLFNSKMQLQTDTMICLNSFAQLGIDEIDNPEDQALIEQCQNCPLE